MFLTYPTIKKILLIVAILTVNFFVSQNIAKAAYAKQTKGLDGLEKQAITQIQEKIKQGQDFKKLFKSGQRLVEKDPHLASLFTERAVEIEPNYRDVRLLLGYAQIRNGVITQAKESLTAALKLDPIYGKTHYLLSKVYAIEGDTARSQESLKKAEEMGYNNSNE